MVCGNFLLIIHQFNQTIMFLKSKLQIHLVTLFTLLFLVSSCSDDSPTGVDESEAPSVPEAVPAEIDNSIFVNNNPTGEEYDAFNEAGILTQTADAQLTGSTTLGQTFLMFTQSQQATFENGVWVWSFTAPDGDEEFSIRTTAEELSGGVEWNVYLSGLFDGESVTEFLYLTGFISNDRQSGEWKYFTPGTTNQPVLEYQWETIDENRATFSMIFTDPEEGIQSSVEYERNGVENTLQYSGFDTDGNVLVYWDSSTGTGYIDREGEDRRCWDESFAETACS